MIDKYYSTALLIVSLCVAVPAAAQLDDCNHTCPTWTQADCNRIHDEHLTTGGCTNFAFLINHNGSQDLVRGNGTCEIDPSDTAQFFRPFNGSQECRDGICQVYGLVHCTHGGGAHAFSITCSGPSGPYGPTASFDANGGDCNNAGVGSADFESYTCQPGGGDTFVHTKCVNGLCNSSLQAH